MRDSFLYMFVLALWGKKCPVQNGKRLRNRTEYFPGLLGPLGLGARSICCWADRIVAQSLNFIQLKKIVPPQKKNLWEPKTFIHSSSTDTLNRQGVWTSGCIFNLLVKWMRPRPFLWSFLAWAAKPWQHHWKESSIIFRYDGAMPQVQADCLPVDIWWWGKVSIGKPWKSMYEWTWMDMNGSYLFGKWHLPPHPLHGITGLLHARWWPVQRGWASAQSNLGRWYGVETNKGIQ